MDAYLDDIIQTLYTMAQNPKPAPDYALLNPNHPANGLDGLEMIVAMECAPYTPIHTLLEIPVESFPPASKLNSRQQAQLLQAIEGLLLAYHFCIDYPKEIPVEKRYEKIRELWKHEEMQHLDEGMTHFDGCGGSPDGCFWGKEYCYCATIIHEDSH